MTTAVTDASPVRWNRKEFNIGIVYNNGIITIDEPGYYRITAAIYTNIGGSNGSKWINLFTMINGSTKFTTKATWASPGLRKGFELLLDGALEHHQRFRSENKFKTYF